MIIRFEQKYNKYGSSNSFFNTNKKLFSSKHQHCPATIPVAYNNDLSER